MYLSSYLEWLIIQAGHGRIQFRINSGLFRLTRPFVGFSSSIISRNYEGYISPTEQWQNVI
jgi:hypothetical protein